MKRYVLILAVVFSMAFESAAQDPYVDMNQEYIPQYFMDGAFLYATMFEGIVDSMQDHDPINAGILHTYSYLSHAMLGTRIEEGRVDANLARIEEHLGQDNTIYGLALMAKAMEAGDDLDILLKAAEIIGETSGDDSWEYALAMFHCSNLTLDIEKYGDSSKSLEYAGKAIEILEAGYQDSWLYHLSMTTRGAARILAQDGSGFDDVIISYEALAEKNDEKTLLPLMYVTIYLATLYTSTGHHDYAIDIAAPIEPAMLQFDIGESEMYMSVNRTLCYAHAMKKNRRKAREYFEKAEQACIARFGKNSEQHKGLQKYREMF